MKDERDALIEKIKKLFALSENNPNEHEAAAAAGKARELLEAHDLSTADLNEKPEPVEEKMHETGKSYFSQWLIRLASVVASHFNCRIVLCSGISAKVKFIGTATDIAIAEYVFVYLRRAIEAAAEKTEVPFGKNGRRWKDSFRCGMVKGVSNNLYRMRRRTEERHDPVVRAKSGDLVVVKRDALEAYMKDKYLKFSKHRGNYNPDHEATAHGRGIGETISINPAVNRHNKVAAIAQGR